MTEVQDILNELRGIPEHIKSEVAAGVKPTLEEMTRLAARTEALEGRYVELQRQLQRTISKEGKIRLQDGKLAGMDLLDLRILGEIFSAKYRDTRRPPRIMEAIAEGRKVLRESITERSILGWDDHVLERRTAALPGMGRHHPGLKDFTNSVSGWTRYLLADHQRALDSTTAAAGDELVPTFEAAEMWLDVNLDTLILPLFQQQPMPSNPFDIPIQFGDSNWYPTDENVQATTTDVTTGKTTLTAYGLKTGVPFSDELEEDAVIALVPEIRASLARNAAQIIDDVLLNADTTVTDGINSVGTTISKTTAGKAHFLLGFDGLIHQPLVNNTTLSSDRNAAADTAMLVKIMGLVEKYGVARRRGEVVWISDPRTIAAIMGVASLLSMQSFGERATLSAGEIREMFAIPLIRSDQMRAASAAGLVSNTAANNTRGRILLVNTTQWRVGFRRQISMEADREPGKSQTTLYVSFRIAFTERTGSRASAKHTALAFNITGI